MDPIRESELILNQDGSIFHLHLKPEQLAEKIILVGDPGRVEIVSSFFEKKEISVENREFRSVTGLFQKKRITVMSTGIGTDNIDIVLNELDALANVDFATRCVKPEKHVLDIVRIGTSGALQPTLPVDSFIMSKMSIGLDSTLLYYEGLDEIRDKDLEHQLINHITDNAGGVLAYAVEASKELCARIAHGGEMAQGITISSPGFYGAQGRMIRLPLKHPQINERLESFKSDKGQVCNYEMESSAVAGLSSMLGHRACTVCVIIANRKLGQYSKNYHPPLRKLIQQVLKNI